MWLFFMLSVLGRVSKRGRSSPKFGWGDVGGLFATETVPLGTNQTFRLSKAVALKNSSTAVREERGSLAEENPQEF